MRSRRNHLWKLSVTVLLALVGRQAAAQNVRVVQGEAFWEGDPGPITDSYWLSGQYKYDPYGFLERDATDPDQFRHMTVIARHPGAANYIFRKRVVITDWDMRHPDLRICRFPPPY